MLVRFIKGDSREVTQCYECTGRLEIAETGQMILHVDVKDHHRPFDAIEVQADLKYMGREYRSTFPSLKDVFQSCLRCGHGQNLHVYHPGEPACIYIDSEGPCVCKEFRHV